jgi:redox-sensitive bicupin YhaK (pirin superfamily)
MGFRQLRVINEDRVVPGGGFPTHSHRDMEILSYVLEGAIEHQDSMGHREVLRPGELQRMSAGRGVTHSEYNPSREEPLHFLQIWILPDRRGLEPGYEQKEFPEKDRTGRLRLVAAPGGRGRRARDPPGRGRLRDAARAGPGGRPPAGPGPPRVGSGRAARWRWAAGGSKPATAPRSAVMPR